MSLTIVLCMFEQIFESRTSPPQMQVWNVRTAQFTWNVHRRAVLRAATRPLTPTATPNAACPAATALTRPSYTRVPASRSPNVRRSTSTADATTEAEVTGSEVLASGLQHLGLEVSQRINWCFLELELCHDRSALAR